MTILHVPITKAANAKLAVDTDTDLANESMFRLVIEEGLKVVLNKRMSKIGSLKGLEGKALVDAKASAMAIAEANLVKLREGKITRGRATTTSSGTKVAGVVMTEARHLAKEIVKNEIRAAGMKVSHVPASDITAAANEMLSSDSGQGLIDQAQANIEARNAKTTKAVADSDDAKAEATAAAKARLASLGLTGESPKLKAKAAEAKAKAKAKASLSATQAGKVAPRKGSAPHMTH